MDSITGNTPLHLAASIPRIDALELLLAREDVDDTIKNFDGLDCMGVANGGEVGGRIQGECR